jgi:hypothetical protein
MVLDGVFIMFGPERWNSRSVIGRAEDNRNNLVVHDSCVLEESFST